VVWKLALQLCVCLLPSLELRARDIRTFSLVTCTSASGAFTISA
jgi:hypothetical protein